MKPRKAPEERSVSHSISCTPLQWARMRELAEGAGMRTSPWIVGRVLKREGFGAVGHALELDGAQQRARRRRCRACQRIPTRRLPVFAKRWRCCSRRVWPKWRARDAGKRWKPCWRRLPARSARPLSPAVSGRGSTDDRRRAGRSVL